MRVLLRGNELKEIQNIQLGDEVISQNSRTGEREMGIVTEIIVNKEYVKDCITINNSLKLTADHPVWDEGQKSWKNAGKVVLDDILLHFEGYEVKVRKIKRFRKKQTVFNIHVSSVAKSYFAEGVLVRDYGKGEYPVLYVDEPNKVY